MSSASLVYIQKHNNSKTNDAFQIIGDA